MVAPMDQIALMLRSVQTFMEWATKFENINGFLDPLEGYVLALFAAHGTGQGEIVEIGSYMGRSTCWLAAGSKMTGREKVTAVDHFRGSPEHRKGQMMEEEALLRDGSLLPSFLKNIRAAGLADQITPLEARSRAAAASWSKPIRLLFIDGDHSYEASKKDFETWSPHVVPEGLIAFHDIEGWPGVTRYYHELMAQGEFECLLEMKSLRVVRRRTT